MNWSELEEKREPSPEKGWSRKRIAEMRELCDAATPGPWVADFPVGTVYEGEVVAPTDTGIHHICRDAEMDERPADLRFIATARTAFPDALDEISVLKDKLLRAECQRDHLQAHKDYILETLARLGCPVADGGQFRADIGGALERLARR